MFFSRKSKEKNQNEVLLNRLDGRTVRYVTIRNPKDYSENIIGREGVMNVHGDELTIVCGNNIVFKQAFSNIDASELMSLEGVNLRYKDESSGDLLTIVAYYKYYRK